MSRIVVGNDDPDRRQGRSSAGDRAVSDRHDHHQRRNAESRRDGQSRRRQQRRRGNVPRSRGRQDQREQKEDRRHGPRPTAAELHAPIDDEAERPVHLGGREEQRRAGEIEEQLRRKALQHSRQILLGVEMRRNVRPDQPHGRQGREADVQRRYAAEDQHANERGETEFGETHGRSQARGDAQAGTCDSLRAKPSGGKRNQRHAATCDRPRRRSR